MSKSSKIIIAVAVIIALTLIFSPMLAFAMIWIVAVPTLSYLIFFGKKVKQNSQFRTVATPQKSDNAKFTLKFLLAIPVVLLFAPFFFMWIYEVNKTHNITNYLLFVPYIIPIFVELLTKDKKTKSRLHIVYIFFYIAYIIFTINILNSHA
ncbi:hypothetical protein KW783_03735 [Candidatus Parcubacteria bacterium]|nr:hypothetical protein [Candidatus Parcubacteria bacterium]